MVKIDKVTLAAAVLQDEHRNKALDVSDVSGSEGAVVVRISEVVHEDTGHHGQKRGAHGFHDGCLDSHQPGRADAQVVPVMFLLRGLPHFVLGTCAKENQQLILAARSEDMWFHVADSPSAHLVAKIHGLPRSKKQLHKIVKRGACLLKGASKEKHVKSLKILYAFMKDVQPTEVDGLVTLAACKAVFV
ncbi:hypothetical protein B484DRAFT_395469 [Ochromonadaceae sp. CCMP2298]|nr:hypothetical protein B484DRAFT_395469 [Ochromonadaceae sp. CCMP2298]